METPYRLVTRMIVAMVLALGVVALPQTASACACGAVVSTSGAAVSGETALVVWDGTRETISMAMEVSGSATDAGWIMPVPDGTEVSLGDKAVFPKLADAAKPVRRTEYDLNPFTIFGGARTSAGAPGAAAAPVQVEKVASVGPFQVTWLTGTQAGAVNTWLTAQGYPTRPAVVPTFQTYLDQGWRILAVKLRPKAGGDLSGTLDPLVMSFAAKEPVYPIALSKHATRVQGVNLYVVAAHRTDISTQATPTYPLSARFAGRVPAEIAGLTTGLGEQSGSTPTVWLTAYSGVLIPAQITQDFRFAQAPSDTPYVTVIVDRVDLGGYTALGLLVLLLGASALIAVGFVRARRPASSRR
jgi:hypothetical protein